VLTNIVLEGWRIATKREPPAWKMLASRCGQSTFDCALRQSLLIPAALSKLPLIKS